MNSRYTIFWNQTGTKGTEKKGQKSPKISLVEVKKRKNKKRTFQLEKKQIVWIMIR